jgi:hypothetical protein
MISQLEASLGSGMAQKKKKPEETNCKEKKGRV